MPSPTFHPRCAPVKRPQIAQMAPPSTQAKLDYFLHISLFLSGPWRNLAHVSKYICNVSTSLHFFILHSSSKTIVFHLDQLWYLLTGIPASTLPPLHTSVQPVLLTSFSGGFILLHIQYHKLTFIHEPVFFTQEELYRIALNRTEVNFECYQSTFSQGGTIQVKNHTWMFCKGNIHAQQWWPQEVCVLESQPWLFGLLS